MKKKYYRNTFLPALSFLILFIFMGFMFIELLHASRNIGAESTLASSADSIGVGDLLKED